MTRPSFRRSLRFDNLESRELLSGSVPSAEQQYMLEMINSARTNPAATADWLKNNITPDVQSTLDYYHVDLNSTLKTIASTPAKPPVAWNSNLASAAQAHSQDMARTKVQSHSGSDGSTSDSRITQSGYGQTSLTGENAYAYASDVKQAMEAFLLDWGVADQGHRRNLLQGNVGADKSFKDVGIGIVHTKDSDFGPVVVTQDFARPANNNSQATLLGVAYSDDQNPGRYDMGEGRGGVQVDATNIDNGAGYSTQTSDAGGYQMSLPAGRYQVTASVNDKVVQTQQINIGTDNVKYDIVLNKSWDGRSRIDVIDAAKPARATTVAAAKTVSATKATVSAPAPVTVSAPTPTPAPVVSIPTAATPTKISTKVSTVAPTSFGAWSSWKANTA